MTRERINELDRIRYWANHEKRIEYKRVWREKNREKLREQDRRLKAKHREKINLRAREWRRDNPEKYRAVQNKSYHRCRTDPSNRLLGAIRRRMQRVLKGTRKSKTTLDLLGCSTIEDFKIYIESKWETGMTWQNYGIGDGRWSLDHIIPCALFDFTKPEHQRRCFHFSNVQPMWSIENSSKHDRVMTNQFNLL